ncbi:MAG: AEC family transporter [Coriobacteriia bacterium]|nr:AEC family transporter [Coriobacteriia bacterium]
MTSSALTTTILTFTVIVAVGAVLRWAKVLRREDAKPINAVIIYAGLPAFIFRAVHGAQIGAGLWRVVLVAWTVFAVMAVVSWAITRAFRMPPRTAGAFIIATALGNTGYIGYPVTQALLGAEALPVAIFYDVFGTVVALVFVGLAVAQHFGEHDESRVNPLRELLTFPAVAALLLALALRPFPIPEAVNSGLGLLASMVAPLIMLSVGLSLRVGEIGRSAVPLAVLSGLRLVVAPALAFGLGMLLLGPGVPLRVTVLEAGMPTMMLTLMVGERFGLDTDFIASAIFVTTALSAVALPLVQLAAFS